MDKKKQWGGGNISMKKMIYIIWEIDVDFCRCEFDFSMGCFKTLQLHTVITVSQAWTLAIS
jgi:hypothetical protein